jgi:hypothetical protein
MSLTAKCDLAKIHGRYAQAGRLHKTRLLNRPLQGACRKQPGLKPTCDPGAEELKRAVDTPALCGSALAGCVTQDTFV